MQEEWELSLWSGQGLRKSLLGKGNQMEELEWGKGGGPQGWVGCHRAYGKREFTRDSDVVTGMTETGGGRQSRRVRI